MYVICKNLKKESYELFQSYELFHFTTVWTAYFIKFAKTPLVRCVLLFKDKDL